MSVVWGLKARQGVVECFSVGRRGGSRCPPMEGGGIVYLSGKRGSNIGGKGKVLKSLEWR